jgi:hypothetical protein
MSRRLQRKPLRPPDLQPFLALARRLLPLRLYMHVRAGERLMSALRLTIAAAVALSVAAPAAASWGGWFHHNYSPRGTSSSSSGGTPVPEPSDFALFALGAAGLIAGRWRAKR